MDARSFQGQGKLGRIGVYHLSDEDFIANGTNTSVNHS